MDAHSLDAWFDDLRGVLESAYLKCDTPWGQSGFSGPMDRWTRLRRPIADLVDRSGSFLDLGCANGFLLECLLDWTSERGLTVAPYGLDVSERLVALARERLPAHRDHLNVGNAWDWEPPCAFDFARFELCYAPTECRREFVERVLRRFLNPGGAALVAAYRSSRRAPSSEVWVDEELTALGFRVSGRASGFDAEGRELTRTARVRRPYGGGRPSE